jgi:transposase InsO family protein
LGKSGQEIFQCHQPIHLYSNLGRLHYLTVVLDVFSRRIVGGAMESYLRTELVLKALDLALGQRRAYGVIHHWQTSLIYNGSGRPALPDETAVGMAFSRAHTLTITGRSALTVALDRVRRC